MDKETILADLRKVFGQHKMVLDAVELAQVLGTTLKGLYSLKGRDGLPVPVLSSGGKLCVSIHAVAAWLAGEDVEQKKPSKPAKGDAKSVPPVPPPRRKRESMGAYLTTLRSQINFLSELHAELERLDTLESYEENDGIEDIDDAQQTDSGRL
jgi:hypothetical protein